MTDRKPYATGREFGLGWPLEPTESETESWIQLANGLVLALAAGFFISWLLLLVLGLDAGFGLHASLVLGIVSCLVIAFSLRRSRVELREELGDLEQIGESGRSRLITSDQIHGLYHEILKDAQIGWYRL